MTTTRILLVADAPFEERLRDAMPELNGDLVRWTSDAAAHWYHGTGAAMATPPGVVALGPGLATETMLALATDLDRRHPGIAVLLVTEPSSELWRRAARAGVRDIVAPDADDAALATSVRALLDTVDARLRPSAPDAHAASHDGVDRHDPVLAVVRSPKGGSGKTMVASNVAVSLARRHPGEVVLVDLDLQFGDLASALGMEPTYTIADATANVDLTPTSLKALLSTHRSNLYTLCAPPMPDEAEVITGDDVTAVLDLLQSAFRFVVVDTAAGSDECTEAALARATDVVLVCSMDVSSVRAIRKDLEAGYGTGHAARRHLVLNRADSKVGLEVRDIEETLGVAIDVRVDSSRWIPLHMNCGIPIVEADPAATVSRQLRELVNRLAPATTRVRPKTRWRRSR